MKTLVNITSEDYSQLVRVRTEYRSKLMEFFHERTAEELAELAFKHSSLVQPIYDYLNLAEAKRKHEISEYERSLMNKKVDSYARVRANLWAAHGGEAPTSSAQI